MKRMIIFLLLVTSFSFAETGLKTFDNYKDAIDAYSEAIEIDSKLAEAYLNRGLAYDTAFAPSCTTQS